MRRPWSIWSTFAASVALVAAAVGWLTVKALELDRAEARARQRALLEENVRLALWRMDSALAPLIARENARPYADDRLLSAVRTTHGSSRGSTHSSQGITTAPSPGDLPPHVVLRFQIDSHGRFTSPRVPGRETERRELAQRLSGEEMEKARGELIRLEDILDRNQLWDRLPAPKLAPNAGPPLLAGEDGPQSLDTAQQQAARGGQEFQARSQVVAQNSAVLQTPDRMAKASQDVADVPTALMTPLWCEGDLLLARRIRADGRRCIQGCLLDWGGIRHRLNRLVEDLLPEARLRPATEPPGEGASRRMAALPVTLDPGPLPPLAETGISPVHFSLILAWGSLLVAAGAVAVLLWGTLSLSERRAAFVSAVTHELRTPLTTFRMYSEMLADGMVPDADTRQRYLESLRTEADRLAHLVDNVLVFARLERRGAGQASRTISLKQLLDASSDRLQARAAQAGFYLAIESNGSVLEGTVRADPAAVEQILFNLVDNACKHAATAADRTLHLTAEVRNRSLRLRLRDHGPGIPRQRSRALFRPFHKSAGEAADSASGVGLGLALSRRLARSLGGDLQHDPEITDGAAFVLILPVATTGQLLTEN